MTGFVGVDIGGTFTDVVVWSGGEMMGRKLPTTPDPSDAVADAVQHLDLDVFLHGTTVATNALLEERGARVALVTDPEFEDLIEIARQDRPSLYDSSVDRPRPLVDRRDRHGYDGDLGVLLAALAESPPEVVAVGLLESYLDPETERILVAALASALDVPVVSAVVISPEFREYERIATTVISAYLTPSVAGYLRRLDDRLEMGTRLIMTSSGGLIPFASAASTAARLVLSGPAGGAVAAAAVGRHHGHETVLSFDMGGTSTDVARITGGVLAGAGGSNAAGRVNRVPAIPIHTIGAGGGSIAWLDSGGALRVGPHSAGAIPGPVAYGRGGTEPTVTDANLALGHIPADLALGGTVPLDLEAARRALDGLAGRAGLSSSELARGVIEVVDSHMEHALRAVSVEEGADPREAVLVAFGGAGGLHAARLAARLGIGKVLIPPMSGVFSALGLLLAEPRADAARTVMTTPDDPGLSETLAIVGSDAASAYRQMFRSDHRRLTFTADVRYRGQAHELEVAFEDIELVAASFEEAHRERFGFDRSGEPVEVVNLRAAASAPAPLTWDRIPPTPTSGVPVVDHGVWRRQTLPPGFEISEPGVIVEENSAVLIEKGSRVVILEDGTLEMTL